MATPYDKTLPFDAKSEALKNLPVIKDYYLVLGGGKIGTDFLEYTRKNRLPFVLVIDRDENAPASREAQVLKTRGELANLLREKAKIPLQEETAEQFSRTEEESGRESKKENKKENRQSEAYFYAMDVHSIPDLFSFGIPENIIPAVPCHAVAYMLADLLKFSMQGARTEEKHKASLPEIDSPEKNCSGKNRPVRPVNELFIRPEDPGLMFFFKTIASAFPEDVIAGRYPEYGMLFFSYAREGEICPDGCPGPKDRCPTFGRSKPKTITEYARELNNTIPGWVFESHQMKPGIGGLKGEEFKRNMLEIMEFVNMFKEDRGFKRPENPEERAFFIATTCTCHGVLNIFYVT